jgi:hypothetical protein
MPGATTGTPPNGACPGAIPSRLSGAPERRCLRKRKPGAACPASPCHPPEAPGQKPKPGSPSTPRLQPASHRGTFQDMWLSLRLRPARSRRSRGAEPCPRAARRWRRAGCRHPRRSRGPELCPVKARCSGSVGKLPAGQAALDLSLARSQGESHPEACRSRWQLQQTLPLLVARQQNSVGGAGPTTHALIELCSLDQNSEMCTT